MTVGGLVATAFIGPVLEHLGNRVPFIIALVPITFIVYPLLGNFLEENMKSREEVIEARRNIMNQRETLTLCFLMFVGTASLSFLGIHYNSASVNATAACIIGLVMLFSF